MNLDEVLDNCQKAIKYEFKNRAYLLEAITHRTYANESKKKMKYNQRLEFLGDSVLSLIISDYLFIENLLRAPFLLSSFTGLSIPSVYKGLNALYTEGNFF